MSEIVSSRDRLMRIQEQIFTSDDIKNNMKDEDYKSILDDLMYVYRGLSQPQEQPQPQEQYVNLVDLQLRPVREGAISINRGAVVEGIHGELRAPIWMYTLEVGSTCDIKLSDRDWIGGLIVDISMPFNFRICWRSTRLGRKSQWFDMTTSDQEWVVEYGTYTRQENSNEIQEDKLAPSMDEWLRWDNRRRSNTLIQCINYKTVPQLRDLIRQVKTRALQNGNREVSRNMLIGGIKHELVERLQEYFRRYREDVDLIDYP